LKTDQRKRRDRLEVAVFSLGTALVELEEVLLRNRQAMRRTSLVVEVLDPAITRLESIRANLRQSQLAMAELWKEEEARRWEKKT
jgi:hypothetical protein